MRSKIALLRPSAASLGCRSRGSPNLIVKVGVLTFLAKDAALAISVRSLRATLIALASLAALAIPGPSAATQLDPEDVMVEEFQSFCLDYYTPTQCAGAIRFILRTSGHEYFLHLDNDESRDGFLDQLAIAVTGGEALLTQGALAAKEGE